MGPNRLIAGRFQINDLEKDLLGRGGMGDVYRATDILSGQFVAVKVLNPAVVERDPDALERFAREGEALRQLDHPNIVRMLVAVEEDGQHYLVMDYVGGGSLADLLEAKGRLPHVQVVEVALDLSDALTRAHRLGIFHRDLKPTNVLLTEEGIPRLVDFGIASLPNSHSLTQTGVLLGTLDYLSPEACQGERLDGRADIWAFGVILYEMLCGQLPFTGDSLSTKLAAILTQSPPDLTQLVPDIPDALADLVYRMLEKDRLQRIPSVRLVGAELEAIRLGGVTISPELHLTEAVSPQPDRFATPTPSNNAPRHNLPTQVTPIIGREAELTELTQLLIDPQVRLITILGAGGMGKTRLALEVGSSALDRFEHGVYFVSLAPLQSAEAVVPAVAKVVGLNFSEKRSPLEQLLDHLRPKITLLLLDNLEQLLVYPVGSTSHRGRKTSEENVVDLVNELLNAAPGVKLLVTSRIRLNIQNEHVFHLQGLEVPSGKMNTEMGLYSAIMLFVQSAKRVQTDFDLSGEEQQYVIRICRLVGGMPLGILLAAAWVDILTPKEIADEIARNLEFLETDLRDIPERQRSIQTVFNYSWNLLGEQERIVFAGLTIFRGGFLREAAQIVTGATLRELRTLVDLSLLHRAPTGRYEIHELLRQYGLEKLLEIGEFTTIQQRHLDYYLSLAKQLENRSGQHRAEWLHFLGDEIDNFRAALDWCLRSRSARTGLRLAFQLFPLWSNYLNESRDWLTSLLAIAPEPTLERARGLEALGHTVYTQGKYVQALEVIEESLALAEVLGDLPAIADATFKLSWPAIALGDLSRSYALLERSMELYKQLDNKEQEAFVVLVMGELARAESDLERARDLHEQSVILHRGLEGNARLPIAIFNLSCVLIHFGELDRSEDLLRESISINLEWGNEISPDLMGFSFLMNARGQPLRATRLLAASDAIRTAIGIHVDVGDLTDYEHALADLRAQLGNVAFESAWAEGQSLSPAQAVALAINEWPEGSSSSISDY